MTERNSSDILGSVNNGSVDNSINTELEKSIKNDSVFVGGDINEEMAKAKLLPKMRNLWYGYVTEKQLHILFGRNNVGKSIIAVQIANDVANNFPEIKCLYFDLEQDVRTFTEKYTSNETDRTYQFPKNFVRKEISVSDLLVNNDIVGELEKCIIAEKANFVVIDNMGAISDDITKPKNATRFVMRMKELRDKTNSTIIIVAHSPKVEIGQKININHLEGSAKISNYVDSVFAIGACVTDESIVYLKQLKRRGGRKKNDVSKYVISTLQDGYIYLQYQCETFEQDLLADKDKKELIAKVMELDEKGVMQKEIADKLNISKGYVSQLIKRYGKRE